MIELVLLASALMFEQDPPTKQTVAADEEVVPGLPRGAIPPLPDRVKWNLEDAVTERTSMRERISLAGFWRFAPVDNAAPVLRSQMGWIDFTPAATGGPRVFDHRFRAADGLWRGKPIDRHASLWAERDLTIQGSQATLKWLNRRVFLVLRGPWADAEIFLSQRTPRPDAPDVKPGDDNAFVHVEPASGYQRDGVRWCDISEQLIYPGTTQISMKLKQQIGSDADPAPRPQAEPYVGLELMPSGPRIESITVRRDPEKSQLELTFVLIRPKGFMLVPGPPVRTIPVTLKTRIDDANGMIILKHDEDVGPIADNERTVKIRVPWKPAVDTPAPVSLHARLVATEGRNFDHPFPVEFHPSELQAVE